MKGIREMVNGNPRWRVLMFAAVQSLLAVQVVSAFVWMSVQGIEINTEFGFVAGTIVGFFFETAHRATNTRPSGTTAPV